MRCASFSSYVRLSFGAGSYLQKHAPVWPRQASWNFLIIALARFARLAEDSRGWTRRQRRRPCPECFLHTLPNPNPTLRPGDNSGIQATINCVPKHIAKAACFGYYLSVSNDSVSDNSVNNKPESDKPLINKSVNNITNTSTAKKTAGKQTLVDFAGWNLAVIRSFDNLLVSYRATPTSKSVINSMIKFEDMYQDIKPGPFNTNSFFDFKGLNDERRGKRMRTYLAKRDLIKTVGGAGKREIVVTTRAHKIFYESYPLAQLRKEKWDGHWTVVTYDIPNLRKSDREYLRRKLKDLGFGCPQESLYVCPLHLEEPLQELIEGEELENFVWVISATRILGLDNKEVATKAWDLGHMNELYTALLEVLPKIKTSKNKKLVSEWQKYFLALDNADPYLPKELQPDDWQGEICQKEFFKISHGSILTLLFGLS